MTPQPIELLQTLVRIDSTTPGLLRGPDGREGGELPLARWLEKYLSAAGYAVELQFVTPARPNLLARLDAHPGAPTLAFEAHMDTVGVEGMAIPPFAAEVRDGRLYGRGACDTKGSMAAMLAALRRLRTPQRPLNLMFIASCAEETGCEGAAHIDFHGRPPDAIVVGEPTANRCIVAHKGAYWITLACRGKAAHGSRPADGDNAIYKMLDAVHYIRSRMAPAFASHVSAGFSGSTIGVNCIQGGVKANIIPDYCTATLDARIVPDVASAWSAQSLVAEIAAGAGVAVELADGQWSPALVRNPHSRILPALSAAVADAGGNGEPGVVEYCTDAGVFAHQGIDSVVFGPGHIAQAHGAVEFVRVDEVCQAADILVDTAEHFARTART
ncbi:MAG: Acetylornithine deacetylase [Lentisphaerae bacterium ADurb.BinA184]|nr:MAG: Acetylornithine deacetylase [Lentisphaerae bacterium ADurb.BinA184]